MFHVDCWISYFLAEKRKLVKYTIQDDKVWEEPEREDEQLWNIIKYYRYSVLNTEVK